MKVTSINSFIILELSVRDKSIGELIDLPYRRISLLPDQITQVESRSSKAGSTLIVSWKEPNAETILVSCDSKEDADHLQEEILHMIHEVRYHDRRVYG